jgi:hypothetical protein
MARGRYGTGTTFAELLLGTRRSIVRAGSGAVSVDAADPSAPPAISNLQLTSTSVLDNYQGTYVSIVKATWDPVVPDVSEDADVDVSPVTDYLCSYAYADEGWSREGGTGGVNAFTTHAVPTGVEVTVRVRARRRSGAVGPYTTATIVTSRDETPPPRPSAPTVIGTVRGVSVGWDGLFVQPDGSGSAPRPPDFAYVIAEVATQPDFSDIVKGGVLSERGQTAVTRLTDGTPFTAYARLVAVDHSGNRSVLSAVTQGGSIRVIDKDVGESAITTAKLAEAAVTAEKILNGAIVAEVRGYMGDIGAYGLHLNADVELGNTQSVIYQVGKRAALAPDVDVRLRKGKWTGFTKNGDGTVDVEFGSAMSQPPTGISLTLGYDTASGNAVTQIVEREVYASHIHAKVRYADGSVPGDGTKVTVYYGAEIVV